ncbi:hypothetical protein D3C73_1580590 [compost metagenome]
MDRLTRIRDWINRDNGRLFRVGNGPISGATALGSLSLVAALLMHLLRDATGLPGAYAAACLMTGGALLAWDTWRSRR